MATSVAVLPPFTNEAIRTFVEPAEAEALEEQIRLLRERGPRHYPVVIGGRTRASSQTIASYNPAHPDEVVGTAGAASLADANEAIDEAARAFESWKRVAASERAAILLRAAATIRSRRYEFDALLMLEVGKTRIEADADTAEAIDFLEFYAREALRYDDAPPLVPVAGEENRLVYIPLGVGVVIPPWNFALAIMAGMTSAALVAGNAVVLKPSSDSPVIAGAFVDVLRQAGLPPEALAFVPGSGRTIGDALVSHPKTRFIAFTGSKEVGLHINELAAKPQPGQIWIKRVIAEMGGKDAIVVAADADLDAAADGIVTSAFGFGGQKCSACSRAIVESAVYDALERKIVERVARLVTTDPIATDASLGPVINAPARETIVRYIARGLAEGGRLAIGGEARSGEGYYVEPTVVADVRAGSTLAREEIFGPVLALMRAEDFEHALALANDTEFGLTGGIYSRDEAKLERAVDEFHVGNLYLNRKCTGALVGAQPFGGFNLSGTDSKAGGYDYLMLFTQAKVVSKRRRPSRPAETPNV
ncbi:MAG: L-glutamate gamma-semialdehyde dehydrogenase [Vulcanimicrobiaceae bacterium]